jgi:myosin protein heavy chain
VKEIWNLLKKVPQKDIDDLEQVLNGNSELEQTLRVKTKELTAKEKELVDLRSAKEEEIEELRSTKDKEITELRSAKEKEIKSLLTAKAKEISGLQAASDALFKQFDEKYETWYTTTNNEKALKSEITELKSTLARERERANSAEGNLEKIQPQLAERQIALTKAKDELDSAKADLREKARQLEIAESDVKLYKDARSSEKRILGFEDLNLTDLSVYKTT